MTVIPPIGIPPPPVFFFFISPLGCMTFRRPVSSCLTIRLFSALLHARPGSIAINGRCAPWGLPCLSVSQIMERQSRETNPASCSSFSSCVSHVMVMESVRLSGGSPGSGRVVKGHESVYHPSLYQSPLRACPNKGIVYVMDPRSLSTQLMIEVAPSCTSTNFDG